MWVCVCVAKKAKKSKISPANQRRQKCGEIEVVLPVAERFRIFALDDKRRQATTSGQLNTQRTGGLATSTESCEAIGHCITAFKRVVSRLVGWGEGDANQGQTFSFVRSIVFRIV